MGLAGRLCYRCAFCTQKRGMNARHRQGWIGHRQMDQHLRLHIGHAAILGSVGNFQQRLLAISEVDVKICVLFGRQGPDFTGDSIQIARQLRRASQGDAGRVMRQQIGVLDPGQGPVDDGRQPRAGIIAAHQVSSGSTPHHSAMNSAMAAVIRWTDGRLTHSSIP